MEQWRRELYHSELYHYGVKHRSGRYPYGSGERPYQDVGKVIKKGDVIYRVTSNIKEHNNGRRLYASTNLDDSNIYALRAKRIRQEYPQTGKKYRATLRAKKDLKIANEDQLVDSTNRVFPNIQIKNSAKKSMVITQRSWTIMSL